MLCRSIEFADEYEKKKAEMVKAHEETNFSYQKKRVSKGGTLDVYVHYGIYM